MLRKRMVLVAAGLALIFAWSGERANAQGVFAITSPSFKDGERLATKNAGNNKQNPNCVGENVSPALSWSNPPAGTKSYALLMFDPEGRPPGGVSHWVAYGIPVSVTGFAEGEVSKQTDKYVGGKSLMGLPHYFGPCTPPGAPHHYTFTLIATDLERDHRDVLEAVSSRIRCHAPRKRGIQYSRTMRRVRDLAAFPMSVITGSSADDDGGGSLECRAPNSSRSSFSSRSRRCSSGSSSPRCRSAA